jgi:hypothetical protein
MPMAILTPRQETLRRACLKVKAVEVDGRSSMPVATLKQLGLVEFTKKHVSGPTPDGHAEITVWITAKGRQWFWKRQP